MAMTKPAKAKSEPDGDEAEFLAAVDAAIAEADSGKGIPYEKVRRWLLSWGTDKELPPPK